MNILILGGGEVGGTLALELANERNDVTVVDLNADRLSALTKQADIQTVQGMASYPDVLIKAGIEDADLLIAVTKVDEINIVACQIAHSLFNTPKKISRIRATSYMNHPAMFNDNNVPIDFIITPETFVTDYLRRLLQNPGALQILNFAEGKVRLVAVKATQGGQMVGEKLRVLKKHIPGVDMRVAAIFRNGEAIIPTGDTIVEPEDEVFFIAARENIRPVIKELQKQEKPYKRIIMVGGGNIGERLALALEKKFSLKLIEMSYDRCRALSEKLHHTVIINGSGSDDTLLAEANIEECDVFIALTNNDQANILSSFLAKKMGCRKVITLITNPTFVDLVQGEAIDIAFSPQQITIGRLLKHVRKGDVTNVHSLRRGAAEAVELVAHGDKSTSKVVGRKLKDIPLPEGVTIGAVVRGEDVLMPRPDIKIVSEDHVIFFLTDKTKIRAVERLFRVDFGFFR